MTAYRSAEERIVRRGLEAWSRVKDGLTFNGWMDVAEALHVGRAQCMQEADTDRPEGRPYNEAFSRWLNDHTMVKKDKRGREHVVSLATIDQGVRSRLDRIWKNRIEIEGWRAAMTIKERAKTNHPNAVWRKWQAMVGAKADLTETAEI